MFERRFLPLVVIFLVSALVLVVGLWAVDSRDQSRPLPAVDSLSDTPDYRWKLVTTWPKNLPGLGAAPENFARYVNEMSGGRLEVRVLVPGK